jgi:molybdopterin biosynthesis enzyme MoaB
MLSRGVAGIRDKTIIVNLPGSTGAVTQSLNAILPGLLHAFEMLEGKKH